MPGRESDRSGRDLRGGQRHRGPDHIPKQQQQEETDHQKQEGVSADAMEIVMTQEALPPRLFIPYLLSVWHLLSIHKK